MKSYESTPEHLTHIEKEASDKRAAGERSDFIANTLGCVTTFPILLSYAKWMHPEGPLTWAAACVVLLQYLGYERSIGNLMLESTKLGWAAFNFFTAKDQTSPAKSQAKILTI